SPKICDKITGSPKMFNRWNRSLEDDCSPRQEDVRMVRWSRQTVGLLIVALAVVAFQVSPSANHRWRRYHWARTANPFNVTLGDNLTSPWSTGGYLSTASTDWSTPTGGWPMVLYTTVVGGAHLNNCGPVSGRVEVCNANYGSNNWLGLAQIWITAGQHIAQGTVQVNDYYFNQSTYNKPEWRQMVLCQ